MIDRVVTAGHTTTILSIGPLGEADVGLLVARRPVRRRGIAL